MKKLLLILTITIFTFTLTACKDKDIQVDNNGENVDCGEAIDLLSNEVSKLQTPILSEGQYIPGVHYGIAYEEIVEDVKDKNGYNFANTYTAAIIVDDSGYIIAEIYNMLEVSTELVTKTDDEGNEYVVLERAGNTYYYGEDVTNSEMKETAKANALESALLEEGNVLTESTKKGEYAPGVYRVELGGQYYSYNQTVTSVFYAVVDNNGNLYTTFLNRFMSRSVISNSDLELTVPEVNFTDVDTSKFIEGMNDNSIYEDDLNLRTIYKYYWGGLVSFSDGITPQRLIEYRTCSTISDQETFNNLVSEYNTLTDVKVVKYLPGVYYGAVYVDEGVDKQEFMPYQTQYTAVVVVNSQGDIAGVHYDRITIYNQEIEGTTHQYYKITTATSPSTAADSEIAGAYFTLIDRDNDGTLSDNDGIYFESGYMARMTGRYMAETNQIEVIFDPPYNTKVFFYKDITFDMDTVTYATRPYVQSDFYHNIPITDEEYKAEAKYNALNGIELIPVPGPMFSTVVTYVKTNDGAALPAGYIFEDVQEGMFKEKIYTTKIDETHPDYIEGNETYLVVVVDEYGNIAGTFANNIYGGALRRESSPMAIGSEYSEPDQDNYDIYREIQIPIIKGVEISAGTIQGYYDGIFIEEDKYDVFYEIDYGFGPTLRISRNCAKFDEDFICELGSNVSKFVFDGTTYQVFDQIKVFGEDNEPDTYYWIRNNEKSFYKYETSTMNDFEVYYVPKMEFNALNTEEFNARVLAGDTDFSDNQGFAVLYQQLVEIVLIK